MGKITVSKNELYNLIEYVHVLLDFIDIEDFENRENAELVKNGYDKFIQPMLNVLNDNQIEG